MNINIRLNKNFTTQYNKLQEEYGTELARINGFDDDQLSYTDFIDEFIVKDTVADASIDGNSNVSHKDIVTLLSEMPKPHRKLLAFNKIYCELQEQFGFREANEWLDMEWTGKLYLHDGDTSTFKHYCFAYDLKDLAEKGLYFLGDGFNARPPKHLITFVDFVKEFIGYASNRSSGAVGLPNLIPYMFYYWKKDCDEGYMGISTPEAKEKYARQNIYLMKNSFYFVLDSYNGFGDKGKALYFVPKSYSTLENEKANTQSRLDNMPKDLLGEYGKFFEEKKEILSKASELPHQNIAAILCSPVKN